MTNSNLRRKGFLGRLLVQSLCACWMVVGAVWAQGRPADATPSPSGDIVRVEIECDAPVDKEGLLRLLDLPVGSPFEAAMVQRSERRLARTQLFTRFEVRAETVEGGVEVRVALERKAVINAVRFQGGATFGASELRRVVRMQEGSPLTDELLEYAVQRIRELYVEEGFADARVEAKRTQLGAGEVDVSFRIEEGEPRLMRTVAFAGTLGLDERTLLGAISVAEGSRYSKSAIKAAEKALRRRLREHRYYDAEVEAHWEEESATSGRVTFDVASGPQYGLALQGNEHLSEAEILALMDLLDRPIVTEGTWRELARRAQRAYQEKGYPDARVQARIVVSDDVPTVHVRVEEGPRRLVRDVRFEGNRALGDEPLRAAMATQPPSWWPWNNGALVDAVFDEDLRRLWFLYRRFGFLEAQIVDARREPTDDGEGVRLVVVIEEGEPTLVETVERDGFEVAEIGVEPWLRPGDAFDSERMDKERGQLAAALYKAGFVGARVEAEAVADPLTPHRVRVRYRADPGPPHVVGDVYVQNNIDTQARVILRELPFRKGERLDPDKLLLGQSQIYKLGLFRTVSVRPSAESEAAGAPREARERDIEINVSERFPGSLQWGFGYNTRDGIRGFAEVGYNNLQGRARRVSVRGVFNFDPNQVRADEYLVNLGFHEPRLADSRWTSRLNFIAQQASRSVDEFSVQRFAFVPALEYPLLSNFSVGVDAQVETASISDVAADVLIFNPRDEGRLVTVSSGPYAVYDGRDDPFQPTRGDFASVRVRVAPAQFGSDIPFVKLVAQHSHYLSLFKDVTVVYAGRVGWGYTLRSDDVLPIRERFFLGGRTTVRGFSENSIGPRGAPIYNEDGSVADKGDNPLGADVLANANLELRFPIAFGLGGATFVDAGAAYLQERPIRARDVRESAGLGLRYATPVGPIGLDYGFKLDRRSGEALGELHFSIGTIF